MEAQQDNMGSTTDAIAEAWSAVSLMLCTIMLVS